MDIKEFREFGKAAIDFIADYLENVRDYDVLPSVQPGYLRELIPDEIPGKSEDWKTILGDLNRVILPGLTHWQSPHFHAYYPAALSYPSIIGETLSAGFGIIGFSWICSPVCTELEVIVMDWLAKFLNLPKHFLNADDGPGGGIIQGSASESVFVAVLAARETAVRRVRAEQPNLTENEIRGRLVAYSSDQSNSCIEKAGLLAATPVRLIPAGDDLIFRGNALRAYIEEDISKGKIPFICIATMGSTGTCAYDDIPSLVPVCQKYKVWLHVDAAYAGALLAFPEYHKELGRGLEHVDSLNFNLHKSLMVNFDACAMWLKNAEHVMDSFNVDRIYLKHKYQGASKIPDYRHWQIPLGRRFRSLKVWITFRSFGAEGLRKCIRSTIDNAASFEKKVLNDSRFELVAKQTLGLVCFRLKGDNKLTLSLLEKLMERKKVYLIQAAHKGRHFLRFAICGHGVEEKDIVFAWKEIVEQSELVLKANTDCNNNTITEKIMDKAVGQITDKLSRELRISVSKEKSKS